MKDFVEEWIHNRSLNDLMSSVYDKSYKTLMDCIEQIDEEQIKTELRKLPYQEFLRTDYWKAISNHKKFLANYHCEECGSEDNLQVHHKTYEHHGTEHEHLEDLIVLCKDCHAQIHKEEMI